jgi:rare lipoprotein A
MFAQAAALLVAGSILAFVPYAVPKGGPATLPGEVPGCPLSLEVPLPPRLQPAESSPPIAGTHRLAGTACYYSSSLEGRKTASGEIFRQSRMTAAHRTLPLGTWVEVVSLATGRSVRVKVNDRGPFTGGFVIDLSKAAARAIGVDTAADRRVEIRVVTGPGADAQPAAGR